MTQPGASWREDFDALLGLGSNIGDKAHNIKQAIELLTADGDIRLMRASKIYRTEPWGDVVQDWFANACIAVATELPAETLLERCLGVEQLMKRVRRERWGPRIIDVDVLVYRDTVSMDPSLMLPHPRIMQRAFVLAPLADIAPDLVIGGKTVADGLAQVDRKGVAPLDE
jgi:2-amino-4-hydroxy-6-hydroxymethyldihydropteridine diphosphokinase